MPEIGSVGPLVAVVVAPEATRAPAAAAAAPQQQKRQGQQHHLIWYSNILVIVLGKFRLSIGVFASFCPKTILVNAYYSAKSFHSVVGSMLSDLSRSLATYISHSDSYGIINRLIISLFDRAQPSTIKWEGATRPVLDIAFPNKRPEVPPVISHPAVQRRHLKADFVGQVLLLR